MDENIVQEFSCEQCGRLFEGPMITFNNKEEFDYHLSLHEKVEKTKGPANSFETQVKIIDTSCELTVFDANSIVNCNTCGKRFLNKEYLDKHVKSVHEPQNSEPQKTGPQKTEPQKGEPQKSVPQKTEPQNIEPSVKRRKNSDATSHIRSAHERNKPHEGKKSYMKDKNNPYKAQRHLQNSANLVKVPSNHTKESANLCPIKPPEERINPSLKLPVSDPSLDCNTCGKTFSYKEDLSMHVRLVHKLQKINPQKFKPQMIEPPVKRIKTSLELCDSDASLHVRSAHERKKPHEGKKPHMKDKNNPSKAQTHLQNSADLMKASSNHSKESGNHSLIEPPEKRINASLKPPVSDISLNCNTCGKTFSNTENLSMHFSAAHGTKKPHKCYVCGIRYSLKETLLTHFKNTLHDKRSIDCKYCSRNFTQKEMEIHVPNFHEGKKPYMCNICEERFWKKTQLNRHLTLKHEEQKQSK